ncbi:MAG: 30S ribosomal protein S6 [Planctomycetota bacterium]
MERNRTYECMCVLDNREVRKGWEPLKSAVTGLFTKHEAKVISSRRWDERRLAYPINGQNRATYLLVYFSSDTDAIGHLRRDLEFSEPVMRYMITDCAEVPQAAYEPEAEFDVNAIPGDDATDEELEAVVEPATEESTDSTDEVAAVESSDTSEESN